MKEYIRMIKHFNKLLSDDKTKGIGRIEKNDFVRQSKLGFDELIKYILSRTGKTTSNEINNYYSEINKLERSVSKQSIFQAREKLNPEVFIYLNKEMVKHYYKNTKIKKEKGFILLSIDGTQLEMPLNENTKEKFGISENHKGAIQTKTLPRCSGLYDVLNHVYLDFKINHITMAEIPMAYEQIKITKSIIGKENCIFLADRNYGATDLFLLFEQLEYKYCFRGKKNFYKHYLNENDDDSIVEIPLDENWIKRFKIKEVQEKAMKDRKVKIRVIRFKKSDVINRNLSNDEEIILFTNLEQNEFTREELIKLYGKRWKIETGYGILKTKMEFERVTSEKTNIILQDVYSQIIVYNQILMLKNIADSKINSNGRYEYQININNLINLFRKFLPQLLNKINSIVSIINSIITKIIKNKEPIRKNRFYKRWNIYINKPPTLKFRVDGKRNPTIHKTSKGFLRISR